MRRPCWQHGPNSESSQLNLVLRLSMRNGRFHAHLAAWVGILSTTMALVAAVLGLLVSEEQAYAVPTLKDKDGGSEKPRKYSSAAHDSTLKCRASPCQIAPIDGCTIGCTRSPTSVRGGLRHYRPKGPFILAALKTPQSAFGVAKKRALRYAHRSVRDQLDAELPSLTSEPGRKRAPHSIGVSLRQPDHEG